MDVGRLDDIFENMGARVKSRLSARELPSLDYDREESRPLVFPPFSIYFNANFAFFFYVKCHIFAAKSVIFNNTY